MQVSRTLCARGAAVLAAIGATPALAAGTPEGVWLNDTGRGAIEIKDCGEALCGHVVWVNNGADAKGCGKQIIGEVSHSGGSTWGGGWVYSPEKKRRYDVELTPLGEDKLRVVGYAGVKLFSKTMIWKRAPADLQRCGTLEAAPILEPAKTAEQAAAKPPEPKISEATKPELPAAKYEPAKGSTPPANSEKMPKTKTSQEKPNAEAAAPAPIAETPAPVQRAGEPNSKDAPEAPSTEPTQEAASESEQGPSIRDLKLGDLDVGKFLKKTRAGNCKLDLPWVKIEFGCE